MSDIRTVDHRKCEAHMIKPLQLHPKLHGVDHTARPTWKLRETVRFYRDILGLPLVHCISAKGWGREKEKHADFLHFFFDSGNDSTIAFFYYIGTRQPPELVVPKGYMAMANHTAWRVESETELLEWQRRLESHGVKVSEFVQHEILESTGLAAAGSSLDRPKIAAIPTVSAMRLDDQAPAQHPPRRFWHLRPSCVSPNLAAQARTVSVAKIRLDSRKSVRPFKGIFCDDISEFESYMASHAVWSPPLDSALSARGKDRIGSSFRRPSLLK
jgi:catechol 2,3-dioxygenase-like lactoylglutathione lyase family enzyme